MTARSKDMETRGSNQELKSTSKNLFLSASSILISCYVKSPYILSNHPQNGTSPTTQPVNPLSNPLSYLIPVQLLTYSRIIIYSDWRQIEISFGQSSKVIIPRRTMSIRFVSCLSYVAIVSFLSYSSTCVFLSSSNQDDKYRYKDKHCNYHKCNPGDSACL